MIDKDEKTVTNVVAFMQEGDDLVDAYSAISRGVASGETAELVNKKIMGFTITVNYDYYYPQYNGYQYPYYKHGIVSVQVGTGSMITCIGNFECVYISRGMQCNSEGYTSGGFVETTSKISRSLLYSW